MSAESDDDTKMAIQLSIVIGVMCVILNVAFYFLADVYYTDKKPTGSFLEMAAPDPRGATKLAFALFTGSVSVGLIGALFAPRATGHGLGVVAGLASFVAAVFAFRAGMPGALSMALLVLGGLFPLLVWRSLARSRAAWSFLAALFWVLTVVLLFGAPKVRSQVGIGLWTAMIIPGLLCVAGVAMTMIRRDYREHR